MERPMITFVLNLTLDWTFFGLTPKYKLILQEELFDLIYYGKGFSYTEACNLPIYLRKFFTRKLIQVLKDKQKAEEKALKKSRSSSQSKRPKLR